jgi:hypothetical protein
LRAACLLLPPCAGKCPGPEIAPPRIEIEHTQTDSDSGVCTAQSVRSKNDDNGDLILDRIMAFALRLVNESVQFYRIVCGARPRGSGRSKALKAPAVQSDHQQALRFSPGHVAPGAARP